MKKIFAAIAAVNTIGSADTESSSNLNLLDKLYIKYYSVKSQKGVTMIEYALIAALVAVVVIGTLTALGTDVENIFKAISTELKGAL